MTDPNMVHLDPLLKAIACCVNILQCDLPRGIKHLTKLCGREEEIESITQAVWESREALEATSIRNRRLRKGSVPLDKMIKQQESFTSPFVNVVRSRLMAAPPSPRKLPPPHSFDDIEYSNDV